MVTHSPTFLGGWGGREGPRQVVAYARGPSAVTPGGSNRSAPLTDVFQSPDLADVAVKDHDVVISEARLPRPSLL
jgi:hypothetical protein